MAGVIASKAQKVEPIVPNRSIGPGQRVGATHYTFCSVDGGPEAVEGLGRLRRRCNRYRWRSRGTLILRAVEAEDWKENYREQKQPNSKTGTFSEALCYIDAKDDPDDEIHKRNEHQDNPPTGPAGDLAQEIGVQNRNNRCPAWLSGFCENFPKRRNHQNSEHEPADPEDWARGFAVR
jgi:hypothetical protein